MVAFLTKQTISQHSSPSSWLLHIYHSAFFIINKQTNNIHGEVNRRDERLRKSIFETDLWPRIFLQSDLELVSFCYLELTVRLGYKLNIKTTFCNVNVY